jgi:5-methylcytosine-specific restriction endonuclease McrA
MSTAVVVLNAGFEPMQRVSLKQAVKMLHRQVAVVEEAEDGRMIGPYPVPKVVRLVRYVAMKWKYRNLAKPAMWSKEGVIARDQGRCAYCGKVKPIMTVDHIVPRALGGKSTWLNTIAACGGNKKSCNSRKGHQTLAESGMKLLWDPWVPTRADLTGY